MVDNTNGSNGAGYEDDWGTETGLVDNFVLRVEESWFATDARYNGGETLLLNWKGKTSEPIGSDGETEFTASFPVGSGWVSNDGGETAVSEKGRGKFNQSSIYGKIIESVKAGKAEGGLGIMSLIAGRGRPTEAKVWNGLTFRMKQVEFNYGGEIGKKSRLMPVEFLGEGVDPADFAAGGTSDAQAASANTSTASAAAPAGGGDLEATLTALAKASDTHQAFVDKALEIPAVSEDATLLERVVDEAGGIYSTARAGATAGV